MLTVGSLFSGIGGFDLGFERAGMRTVWFCEQDAFCQRVLARHWPGVPVHPDVRALVGHADGAPAHAHAASSGPRAAARESSVRPDVSVPVPYVDVLCGGFPCQDISTAGRGAGIDGARSGLWAEYARLIRDLRPRYVVVENVAALLTRGMERVLGDLAACGYDAEWDCIPASAVGAPHRRDRVWLIAYPQGDGRGPGRAGGPLASGEGQREPVGAFQDASDPQQSGLEGHGGVAGQPEVPEPRNGRSLADADRFGAHRPGALGEGGREEPADGTRDAADADRERLAQRAQRNGGPEQPGLEASLGDDAERRGPQGWWLTEPDVGRVAHGIPQRVDRLRSLGNALVPQIAEWLGRRILEWERLT